MMKAVFIGLLVSTIIAWICAAILLVCHGCGEPAHFTTKHGIMVFTSSDTELMVSKKRIEAWTEDLILFWEISQNWDRDVMLEDLQGTLVYFYDRDFLTYEKKDGTEGKAVGLAWIDAKLVQIASYNPKTFTVTYDRLGGLFWHEVSHLLVGHVAPDLDQNDHHKFFIDSGLTS